MNQPENNTIEEKPARWLLMIAQLEFAAKKRWISIILAIVFLAFVIYDWKNGWNTRDDIKNLWTNELDQIVSLATLMVALLVWWNKVVEDWKNSLPKRLTVHFKMVDENGEQEVMRCIKAHLSHVADIRNLGQQIGWHMNGKKNIDFRAPYIIHELGIVLHDDEIKYYMHYEVVFTLNDLDIKPPPGKCREWRKPFSKDDFKII